MFIRGARLSVRRHKRQGATTDLAKKTTQKNGEFRAFDLVHLGKNGFFHGKYRVSDFG